jgi:NADH:ubiquinone oxidoreductase subunit 6 (subunit J)
MKQAMAKVLNSIQRPVALMLTLISLGALAFSCLILTWAVQMGRSAVDDSHVADLLAAFATLFREYTIPVVVLSLILAALNLVCAFRSRVRSSI